MACRLSLSANQQVAASLSLAAMRSRLLLSVAHLPTIREASEEMLPGGPGQELPASPSLDDYVRSICQLAQPTSVLDMATARVRPSRPHRTARACEKSCPPGSLQDITTHFSAQQPAAPRPGTADPLDWLFGESQEKRPSRRELPRMTGPSAEPRGPRRQMDSSNAWRAHKGRLGDARMPRHSLARPLRDGHQDTPNSRCPSSVLRTLCLQLPVIHEL
nr:protein DEPP1 isoform X1 [Equus asinus]